MHIFQKTLYKRLPMLPLLTEQPFEQLIKFTDHISPSSYVLFIFIVTKKVQVAVCQTLFICITTIITDRLDNRGKVFFE